MKDTFYFMRKHRVNVMRYLPPFLSNSPTFNSAQNSLSIEHERYRLKVVDIAKQFFLESATWGLSDWERFLGIVPRKDSTFDSRKAYCRVKLRGLQTMTPANTILLMQEFMTSGSADVVELGDDEIRLVLDNGVFYWQELFKALWEYLPAHLDWSVQFNTHFDWTIFHALTDVIANNELIDYSTIPTESSNVNSSTILNTDDVSTVAYDFVIPILHSKLFVASFYQSDGYTEIKAESQNDDFDGDLYKIIWENWQRWKRNAVVQTYAHHFDIDEGEIDDQEPEYFPDGDFLRIYFSFPYNRCYRYLTVYNPKYDLQSSDIKDLGNYSAANQAVVSRNGLYTTGISRAILVKRSIAKIF